MPFSVAYRSLKEVRADAHIYLEAARCHTGQAVVSRARAVGQGGGRCAKVLIRTAVPLLPGSSESAIAVLAAGFADAISHAARLGVRSAVLTPSVRGAQVGRLDAAEAVFRAVAMCPSSGMLHVILAVPDPRRDTAPEERMTAEAAQVIQRLTGQFGDIKHIRKDAWIPRLIGEFALPGLMDTGEDEPDENLLKRAGRESISFRMKLFQLIDERHLTDPEVYRKANVDRKLFSKIRCNPCYYPRKRTILALAVALELSLPETTDLLARAGKALSLSNEFDLILIWYITNKNYDICEINRTLFRYNLPMLGVE